MKNNYWRGLCFFSLALTLFSCQTSKQLTYFSDLSDTAAIQTLPTAKVPPLKLQADDQVQVSISSPSAEASSFFNLMALNPAPGTTAANSQSSQSVNNLYTLSTAGVVTLPVLGDFQAAGLTIEEFKQQIILALKPYLTNPIVSIRLANFRVTVIGEVNKPYTVPVSGEKINVLEAIGASGDMTVYGARKR